MSTPRPKSEQRQANTKEPEFKHRSVSDIENTLSRIETWKNSVSLIDNVLRMDADTVAGSSSPIRNQTLQPAGMPPKRHTNIGKEHAKGKRPWNPAPKTITPPTSSPERPPNDSTALTRLPLPRINQWDHSRPQRQRGDVQPLNLQRPILLLDSRNAPVLPSEKVHILKICLVLSKQYLDQPSSESYSEHPFWTEVFRLLDAHPVIQSKFPLVQTLKQSVSSWCEQRRNLLARGELFPVGAARDELEVVVDDWNKVWAKRYSKIYKPAFILDAWSTVEDCIKSFIQTTLQDLTNKALEQRMKELRSLIRPPLLKGDSTHEDYHNYMEYLQQVVKGRGPDSFQIRESEGIMSLIVDLQPGLEEIIRHHMHSRNSGIGTDHKEEDSASIQVDGDASGDVNMTAVPSVEPRTPAVSSDISRQCIDYGQKQTRRLEVAGVYRGNRVLGDVVSSPLQHKRKVPHHDAELDRGGASSKQGRVDNRIGSPDSATSTWSFPSIDELDIRRRLASPDNTPTRQPAYTPTGQAMFGGPDARRPVGQGAGRAQDQRAEATASSYQLSQPPGPVATGFPTPRLNPSSLSMLELGSGDRTGQNRAAKLLSGQHWNRRDEFGPQSAGQGQNRPIAECSSRENEASGGPSHVPTTRWFRESTSEFHALELREQVDKLYHGMKLIMGEPK